MDLNDFRQQIIEIKKTGSRRRRFLLTIHGLKPLSKESGSVDADREITRILAIIDSMTLEERSSPVLMTVPNRCLRVANGAGVEPYEVSNFFTQFKALRGMMIRVELGGWRKV